MQHESNAVTKNWRFCSPTGALLMTKLAPKWLKRESPTDGTRWPCLRRESVKRRNSHRFAILRRTCFIRRQVAASLGTQIIYFFPNSNAKASKIYLNRLINLWLNESGDKKRRNKKKTTCFHLKLSFHVFFHLFASTPSHRGREFFLVLSFP